MQGSLLQIWPATWLPSPPAFFLTHTPKSQENSPTYISRSMCKQCLYLERVSAPIALWAPLVGSSQGCSSSMAGPLRAPMLASSGLQQSHKQHLWHLSQGEKALRHRYICLKLQGNKKDPVVLHSLFKTPRFTDLR